MMSRRMSVILLFALHIVSFWAPVPYHYIIFSLIGDNLEETVDQLEETVYTFHNHTQMHKNTNIKTPYIIPFFPDTT